MTERLVRALPPVLVAFAMAAIGFNAALGAFDNDLWWHLRLGYDFLQQGNLHAPRQWSSMATQSWVPTEPLPEVVMAIAHRWWGFGGVVWLFAVARMTVLAAVYVGNRVVGRALPACIASLVALIGCSISLTPRPQLVSFVLLAVVLRAWNRTSHDLQPRFYLIPLIYGWSLCHGFWFIGVAYGLVEVAGLWLDKRVAKRQISMIAAVPVLSGLVVLLNPVGPGVFLAPFAVNNVHQFVSEWQHPTLMSFATIAVLGMQVAVVVAWCLDHRLWSWRRTLLLLSSLFWLWYAWRTVAVASIVAAPLFTEALDALIGRGVTVAPINRQESSPKFARSLLAGWFLTCSVALALAVPRLAQYPPADTPIDRQLDALPAGTVVFNYYDVGGWIRWRHPDLDPVIDGLITPYSATYVADYFAARDAKPGWRQFVIRTGAQIALLEHDQPLTIALERSNWTITARYQDYVVLRAPT